MIVRSRIFLVERKVVYSLQKNCLKWAKNLALSIYLCEEILYLQ